MRHWKLALAASTVALLAHTASAQDLTVWGLQAFNEEADALIGQMVEDFAAERGIDAEYSVVPADVLAQRLAAAFEGGAPPDAFMQVGGQAQYYAGLGLTEPLDDVLEYMRSIDGGIYEGTVSQGLYQGQAHAVPIEVDVVPTYVRTDLLEKVGVGIPTTFDELRTAAQKVLEMDPTIAGFGLPTSTANDSEGNIRLVVWAFGGYMFEEDGATVAWNSPETIAAYQFISDMFDEGTIPRSTLTWDDGGNNTAYQTGKAAIVINPPSIYAWMVANDEELLANTALVPLPSGPGPNGRSVASVGSWMWLVANESENIGEAKEWLKYFFEPTRYEHLIDTVGGRWVPIYPNLTDNMSLFTDTPAFENFGAMAQAGIVTGYKGPPSALVAEVNVAKIVTQSVQKVIVDGDSAEDAVAWATEEIEKLAAKY